MFLTKENGMRIVAEIEGDHRPGMPTSWTARAPFWPAPTPSGSVSYTPLPRKSCQQQLPVLEVAAGEEGPGAQQGVNLPIYVDGKLRGGHRQITLALPDPGAGFRCHCEENDRDPADHHAPAGAEPAGGAGPEPCFWRSGSSPRTWTGPPLPSGARCWTSTSGSPSASPFWSMSPTAPPSLRSSTAGGFCRWPSATSQGEQTLCAVVNRRLLLVFGPEQKALGGTQTDSSRQRKAFMRSPSAGGLSSLSRGAEDIPAAADNEAKIAARAAAKNHTILEYSGISLDFVLQNLEPKVKADVRRAISEAVPQDEREELLECLVLDFRCEGNVERAAQSIHVHKNTFRYRMGKLGPVYRLRPPPPQRRRDALYRHAVVGCRTQFFSRGK